MLTPSRRGIATLFIRLSIIPHVGLKCPVCLLMKLCDHTKGFVLCGDILLTSYWGEGNRVVCRCGALKGPIDSEISILKIVSLCRTENKSVWLKARTLLVYEPGVLVTVSLTSLTPLPTSKKTNYHFQKHLFFGIRLKKMSD